MASISPQSAVVMGAGLLTVIVWTLWRLIRTRARTRIELTIVGNLVFVLASVTLIATGRAHFDLSVAAESRYLDIIVVGWASLLLALLPAGVSAGRVGRAAAITLPALALAALPVQLFLGEVWRAKADHLATAGLALAVGVDDAEWLTALHPDGGAYVRAVLPPLEARRSTFLAFPDRDQLSVHRASPAPVCDGRIDATHSGDALSGRRRGMRVQGSVRDRGTVMRIVDADARVRGLAHASAAVTAHVKAKDIVWTVVDEITGMTRSEGRWIGFSASGSGPPYSGELLDASGRLICRVEISCCREFDASPAPSELVIRGGYR
jgi:hypothetical protein